MSRYSINSNQSYTSPKRCPVSLQKYIIIDELERNKKLILFQFINNFKYKVKSISFELVQYDSHNQEIDRQILAYDNFEIKEKRIFVPYAKSFVMLSCDHVEVNLMSADFDFWKWENNKWYQKLNSSSKKTIKKDKKRSNDIVQFGRNIEIVKNKNPKFKTYNILTVFATILIVFVSFLFIYKAYKHIEVAPYEERFIYEVTEEEEVIINEYIGKSNDVVIPSSLEGKPVVEIKEGLFSEDNIKSVDIRLSDLVVTKDFFKGCDDLEKITFRSVLSVDEGAFAHCPSLEKITASYFSDFNYGLFKDNPKLKTLDLGVVNNINNDAFVNSESLETIKINHINYIGKNAFENCEKLENVIIQKVITIKDYAFYSCDNLKKIKIDNCNIIGEYAFAQCNNLLKAELYNIGLLGSSVFKECARLQTFKFNSINEIGNEAFLYCPSLQSVEGQTISTINKFAFGYCSSLKDFNVGRIGLIKEYSFESCSGIKNLVLSNLGEIEQFAFVDCKSLETFISGLDNVPLNAFMGCTNLKQINVPNATVYSGSFQGSANVETISYYKTSVESLGSIFGCSNDILNGSITTVSTGQDVITKKFFKDISSLEAITFTNRNYVQIDYDAFDTNKLKNYRKENNLVIINEEIVSVNPNVTELTIPKSIQGIYHKALHNCGSNLKVLHYDNEVVDLTRIILEKCNNLEELYISEHSTMDYFALNACKNLRYIEMPCIGNGFSEYFSSANQELKIKLIGSKPLIANYFSQRNNIVELEIPTTITEIGSSALSGCDNLLKLTMPNYKSIKYYGDLNNLEELVITNSSQTFLEEDFIIDFPNLRKVTLCDNITKVGKKVISRCPNLLFFELPDNVKSVELPLIGENCYKLSTIKVPFIGLSKDVPAKYFEYNYSFEYTDNIVVTGLTTISKITFSQYDYYIKSLEFNGQINGNIEGTLSKLQSLKYLKLNYCNANHLGFLFKDNEVEEIHTFVPDTLEAVVFENMDKVPSIKNCTNIKSLVIIGSNSIYDDFIDNCTSLTNIYIDIDEKPLTIKNFSGHNKVQVLLSDRCYFAYENYSKKISTKKLNYENAINTIFCDGNTYEINCLIIFNFEIIANELGIDYLDKQLYSYSFETITYPYFSYGNNFRVH